MYFTPEMNEEKTENQPKRKAAIKSEKQIEKGFLAHEKKRVCKA
jgi:hypothetical protein